MKQFIFILVLVCHSILFAQVEELKGNYELRLGNDESHTIIYKLTLNTDGTFVFHSFNKINSGNQPAVNKYGKGNWLYEDKVVSFFADKENSFDEKYTLNFDNSKARFVVKSPRDKTNRIVKTRLQFFESEMFWIKSIEMFKL